MPTSHRYYRNGALIGSEILSDTEAEAKRLKIVLLAGWDTPCDHNKEMARRRANCSPCGAQNPNLGNG